MTSSTLSFAWSLKSSNLLIIKASFMICDIGTFPLKDKQKEVKDQAQNKAKDLKDKF
jgi:hypothetical protein